jgi:valyl-tRNA synthetase
LEPYPQDDIAPRDEEAARGIGRLIELLTSLRQSRADESLPIEVKASLTDDSYKWIHPYEALIRREPGVVKVEITGGASSNLIEFDLQRDFSRLLRENVELEKVIANSKRQLENPEIVRKMPEKVVETLRTKLADYEAKLAKNHFDLEKR